LANLFDKKTIEVLKKLLLKDGTFYLRDISRDTSVSLSTTFRIVQKLMGLGLVEKDQVEKFTIYKVKRDSAVFQDVYGLVFGKIDDPASQIRKAVSEMYPAAAYKIYKTDDKEGKIFVVFQDVYGLVFGKIDDPASQIRKAVSEMYPAAAYKIYKTDDKEGKIFVVSSHIKQSEIEDMVAGIVNITGKKPACMLVTPEFFENMQTMGLVNKDKLVKI